MPRAINMEDQNSPRNNTQILSVVLTWFPQATYEAAKEGAEGPRGCCLSAAMRRMSLPDERTVALGANSNLASV
jgi:hypothetical protein